MKGKGLRICALAIAAALVIPALNGAWETCAQNAAKRKRPEAQSRKNAPARQRGHITVRDYVNQIANSDKGWLEYEVVDGDTVYFDVLHYSMVYARLPKQKGRDWRQYYRLVYNFSKTYPYAIAARKMIEQADSTFEADKFRKRDKEKYVNELQDRLFKAFEKPMRNMTITQGQLLMKLIDREAGVSSYNVIRNYKNRMAAGFWQGVAKIFGTDMKKHYDPEGDDKLTEELVQLWIKGDFPAYYWSLFGEYPAITEVPSNLM